RRLRSLRPPRLRPAGRPSGCGPQPCCPRANRSQPLQGVLSPGVDVTDNEDRNEGNSLNKAGDELPREGDGPGIKEHNLQVEDHEEQRDQVIAEVELDPGIALGLNTAYVGLELNRIGRGRSQVKNAEENR